MSFWSTTRTSTHSGQPEWIYRRAGESTGTTGKKAECLDFVGSVWTDMRPLRVREEKDFN